MKGIYRLKVIVLVLNGSNPLLDLFSHFLKKFLSHLAALDMQGCSENKKFPKEYTEA